MSTTSNTIILRPRFKIDIAEEKLSLLKLFEKAAINTSGFIVTRVDDHVFIKVPKTQQHFWSPELHLEINTSFDNENHSVVYGLFGPKPSVWTLFIFLHFVVAALFIGFCIWTYVNWSLSEHYTIPLFLTLLMILVWFILYFGGRIGRQTGTPQMYDLHHFMREVLKHHDLNTIK